MARVDRGADPDMVAPALRYMSALDGLRGTAVVAVVLFHAGHLRGGYLGVDVFFVLSGFLITSLLLAEATRSGTVALGRFWGRRARRLLPALGVLLAGVAAYAVFVAEPEELHRIRWDGIATMFYVANWREVFAGADYWALFTAPSPLAHTWSLAIEEQFYVLWPMIVLAIVARVRRGSAPTGAESSSHGYGRHLAGSMSALCAVAAVAALVSQAWWQHRAGWNRVYFGTDTRAFALLCGAGLASFTRWREPGGSGPSTTGRGRHVFDAAGLAGAVVLVVLFFTMGGESRVAQRGGLALCSLAGTAVVAAASGTAPGILARALSVRPLVGLGKLSYGVYLYHWPIAVWLSRDRVGLSGWPLLLVQSIVTLGAAALSYRFVEQPIRHGARRSRAEAIVVPATAFAAVGVLLVAATMSSMPAVADTSADALREAKSEHFDGPTVLVVGNSVAYYLGGDGFPKVTTDPPIRAVNVGRPACQYPPTSKVRGAGNKVTDQNPRHRCNRVWPEVTDAYRPDWVVFARNGVNTDEIFVDGEFVAPCTPAYDDYYEKTLRADVRRFADGGATTVLVTSVPSVQRFGQDNDLYADYLVAADCGNAVIRRVAAAEPGRTLLVDLQAQLCPDHGSCATHRAGVELRPDGTHFRGQGAQVVAAMILEEMGIEASPTS